MSASSIKNCSLDSLFAEIVPARGRDPVDTERLPPGYTGFTLGEPPYGSRNLQ